MSMTSPAAPRPPTERRFWLASLGLILAIAAATGLVALRGSTVSIGVATTPASGATIAAKALIGLTFPTGMRPDSVVSRLHIEPALPGMWSWDVNGTPSDRAVRFLPSQPLAPGTTYRATLAKGAQATNGRAVARDTVWSFTIRPASLLFLRVTPGGAPNLHNLWTANADGSGPRQITNERGDVLDYTAAPDGSRIAYVVRESQQATSLWAINLDGTGRTRLSPANDPSLYASPAWSPAGDVIVYTLRSVVPSGAPAATIGTSKLWAVAPDGRSLGRIYGRGDEVGFDPVWSPDGARLAFRGQVSDTNASTVVLSDLSADPYSLPAGPGSRITWSPDSGRAALDESVPDATGRVTDRIVVAGFGDGSRQVFLGTQAGHESEPAWSPGGGQLAFIRQDGGTPATSLWVANVDGSGLTRLLGGDGLSCELPSWSPDGTTLVTTRVNGATGEDGGIWIVGAKGGGAHSILPDGERVTWIP
jgi:Tol biopolymer transport system component